jgi:pectinesterase
MSSTRSRAALIAGFAALLVACSEAAPDYGGERNHGATASGGSGASIGGASTGGTVSGAGSAGAGPSGAGGSGGIGPSGGAPGGGFGGAVSGGAGGSDAGAAGAGGANGGTEGAGDAGAAGSAGSSTGGSGGAAGGSGGAGGSAGVGGLGGTPARPVLTGAQAANFTILAYLARTGTVTAPTTDNWDPTAGVGNVATFTATYTVAKSGGTHTTVQAAITAAVNAGGSTRVYVRVMPDTYREVVCVPTNAPPITLYSTSADASLTTIVYNHLSGTTVNSVVNTCATPSGATYGTSGSATFAAYGANFMMKNITVSNDGDEATVSSGTQGVALSTRNDKNVFENVRLLGNQDTVLVGTNDVANIRRAYFKGAYVEGDVDFICGRGTAVFDGGTIRLATNRRSNGNALAPSTDARNPYGFLIIGATFTAAGGAQTGGMTLGRAWDESQVDVDTYTDNVASGVYPNGQALVRDSILGTHVKGNAPWAEAATTSRPFSSTPTATLPANRLYEYNNTGP